MFALNLRELEPALAQLHDVSPSKRSAFAARLKHLQKIGFPIGTNTGKGRPAAYTFEATCQLLVAFELMQFGMIPVQAISYVNRNWSFGRISFASALKEIVWWDAPAGERFGMSWLWILRPQLLAELTDAEEDDADDLEIIRLSAFEGELWKAHRLEEEQNLIPPRGRDYRVGMVNISWALREFLLCLNRENHDIFATHFLEEVNAWQFDPADIEKLADDLGDLGLTILTAKEDPRWSSLDGNNPEA